jgi:hypothetical protein
LGAAAQFRFPLIVPKGRLLNAASFFHELSRAGGLGARLMTQVLVQEGRRGAAKIGVLLA